MPDREKVIKGLYEAARVIEDHVPARYIGYAEQACWDALALLREQEPVEPNKPGTAYKTIWSCGACSYPISTDWVACPSCGKAVKWDG